MREKKNTHTHSHLDIENGKVLLLSDNGVEFEVERVSK